jgi:signal transduction histidine kinase
MTVQRLLGAARHAMALGMFLAAALAAKGALAAWQAADGALVGVGVIALLAVAAVIHLRAGLLRERLRTAELQAAALGEKRNLEAGLKAAGIHVFSLPRGDDGRAARESCFAALSDLLAGEDLALVKSAADGLTPQGKALSMRCAGRLAGEMYTVDGFAAAEGEVTLILRDCAEETARTEQLDAEIAHLGTLLDALEIPIWRRAADLDLTWCNKAYARHVDSTPHRVSQEQGPEFLSGASKAKARALAASAMEAQATQHVRKHVVAEGERRYFDIVEKPLEGGGTVGWALDISDLEKAEADLNRHIDAHAQVLQSLNTSIAIYAPDTRLIFFNSEFCKLYRLDEGWLAGEPTLSEVLEAQREKGRLPEQADWRQYKTRMNDFFTSITEPEEELLHLPDGSTVRHIVLPHPFGGLQFMSQDVTDRYSLERDYSRLTAVQRATLDNLFEAVAVFGADGRLQLSNPGFATLWELDQEQLDGEPHMAELTELSRGLVDDGEGWETYKTDHIARISERARSTMRLERRDEKVLDCTYVPLPDGATLITYLDITDSFQVERALRDRAKALEATDRLKSEFIANVSYELRTPLNTVIGFTEILANQYFGQLNERQQEYVSGILQASQQLLSLINNILDLATIEAGLMVLEVESIDVHDILMNMLNLIQERVRSKQLQVSFDCPQDIGRMDADERRLKQIVFNLLNNAIKYTPANGAITVGARRDEDEMVIWVRDSGIGISDEEQTQVFERFWQADNPLARQGGTGLGLSLVKNFVELHGGRVVLESALDKGTTVTCFLPVTYVPPTEAEV